MLAAVSECHSLCHLRHSICLQKLINPIAYVPPGIPSYPSARSPSTCPPICLPFLTPCLPLPTPTPIQFPLPVAPLPVAYSKSPSPCYQLPVSPTQPPSFLSTLPLPPSHSPPLSRPLPSNHCLHKKKLHLNQNMLQLLLSFCSFTHLR